MQKEKNQMLVDEALEARKMSYCPYSNYSVGAALMTKSGKIYRGCNIESAAYTPSNCAERTAFFKAVSEGDKDFIAIAVVGGKHGEEINGYFPPCGVCRQVMMEFCNPETFEVIIADTKNTYKTYKLKEMLPLGFGPNDLKD